MTEAENTIARRLIRTILEQGCSVSIWDGGGFPVTRSTDYGTIMSGLASTDEDNLFIRAADGRNLGVILLVWGNDADELIADHTDMPEIEAIVRSAGAVS